MGPWKKFESTVVRLKSYEDTGSVVCLTTKGWVKFNDNATGEKHKQNG
jgi:hypothetical protein